MRSAGGAGRASLGLVLDVVRSDDGIVRVRVLDQEAGLDYGFVLLDELGPLIEAMVAGSSGPAGRGPGSEPMSSADASGPGTHDGAFRSSGSAAPTDPPPGTELLHRRNQLSRAYLRALCSSDVERVLAETVRDDLGCCGAALFCSDGHTLQPVVAVGEQGAALAAVRLPGDAAHVADAPLKVCTLAGAGDAPMPTLLVAAGPARGADVLALAYRAPVPVSAELAELAVAVATEAAAALRRVRLAEQLADADRQRLDFMAGVTHGLRTPLTALIGSVGTLRRSGDRLTQDERREHLEIVERQARRIDGLVDDLLLGAQLDAGELAPAERRVIDLRALVEDALDVLGAVQRARVDVLVPAGLRLEGDRAQLGRVIHHLVGSALARGGPGPVTVRGRHAADEVQLEVRDQGRGVEGGAAARLEPASCGERHGSADLGLSILKGIAEAHGGEIDIESPPGAGTAITVRLPAA